MRIHEFIETVDSMEEGVRADTISKLYNNLSPPSKSSLLELEKIWDFGQPYEEFVKAQNDVLKNCLELEMAAIGVAVRAQVGLKPMTGDTEI